MLRGFQGRSKCVSGELQVSRRSSGFPAGSGAFLVVPERYCKFTGVLGAYQGVSSDLRGVLCGFRRVVPYHGASEVSRYVYGGLRIREFKISTFSCQSHAHF